MLTSHAPMDSNTRTDAHPRQYYGELSTVLSPISNNPSEEPAPLLKIQSHAKDSFHIFQERRTVLYKTREDLV